MLSCFLHVCFRHLSVFTISCRVLYTTPYTDTPPVPARRRSPHLQALLSSVSAPTTGLPVYSPVPADLNLYGAGKPLSFSSAIRGPHGKECVKDKKERDLKRVLLSLDR